MPKAKTVVATYQPVTIRIPMHIYDEICDVAEEEDRSMNEQIVRIVKLWYSAETKRKQGQVREIPDDALVGARDA